MATLRMVNDYGGDTNIDEVGFVVFDKDDNPIYEYDFPDNINEAVMTLRKFNEDIKNLDLSEYIK